jgi:hypothetical protein
MAVLENANSNIPANQAIDIVDVQQAASGISEAGKSSIGNARNPQSIMIKKNVMEMMTRMSY